VKVLSALQLSLSSAVGSHANTALIGCDWLHTDANRGSQAEGFDVELVELCKGAHISHLKVHIHAVCTEVETFVG